MMTKTKNFVSGTLAGAVGTIVSQPFFTIKTFLQNGGNLKNITLSLPWLYRGIGPAVVGYSIEKSLVFGTFGTIIKYYDNAFVAGLLAGTVASFSIAFFEQQTINKQTLNSVYSFRSNLLQYMRGLPPTMLRESVGFSIYFSVYTRLSELYNKEKNLFKTGLIGIPSIISAWTIITPIDKIKTNVQSSNVYKQSFSYKNFIKKSSIFDLYRGFSFVMLRAIPFHTTCFVVFEMANKYLVFND